MKLTSVFLCAGLGTTATLACAQSFAQALARTSVTIIEPSTTEETELLEGDLVSGSGDVEVDPSLLPGNGAQGSHVRPAAFQVTGKVGAAFALALPWNQDCTLEAAGATLALKAFKVSVAGGPATTAPGGLTLDGRGTRDFKVGATVAVAADQPRRAYVGTFSLTLAYN